MMLAAEKINLKQLKTLCGLVGIFAFFLTNSAAAVEASRIPGALAPTQFGDKRSAPVDTQSQYDPQLDDKNDSIKFGNSNFCNSKKFKENSKEARDCFMQSDSYQIASEAYSYLGIYATNKSAFAQQVRNPKFKEMLNSAMQDCLGSDNSNCDDDKKSMLVSAIYQTNFVRDIKAKQIESSDRLDRIRSLRENEDEEHKTFDPTYYQGNKNEGWERELETYKERKTIDASRTDREKTFRLSIEDVQRAASFQIKNEEEKKILGERFLNDYRAFVGNYLSGPVGSSNWYRQSQLKGKEGEQQSVWVRDPNGSNILVEDQARKIRELKVIQNPKMRKIAEDYLQSIELQSIEQSNIKSTEEKKNMLSGDLRTKEAAIGLPSKMINPDTKETIEDPKEIAAQVVREIDHVITTEESKLKTDRAPSNSKDSQSPPVIP
ncbi:MAG: hypothetical protein M9962_10570, partial [Oligoflexia bacterium]|nr:hypothetical protein [Oligoflexia bacterium]